MRQRFGNEHVASDDRFAFWREVICAVYVQLDVEPLMGGDGTGSIDVDTWGDVRVSHVRSGPQLVRHHETDPRSDFLVSLQVRGEGVVSQDGRDAVIGPGDFALYDATRSYQLRFDQDFEQIVVQFPRQALTIRNVDAPRAVATTMVHGRGVNDVAASMALSLSRHHGETPDWVRARLADQLIDCLATALALQGHATDDREAQRAVRRRRVLEHVRANLAAPDLTVAGVAAELGYSTRSLQKLFDGDETLSAVIRGLRMRAAHDALGDPARSGQSVASVGADHGFGDPAAFARAFRRHFGVSPSEVRVRHRNGSPPA